jgi:hypothetical protein
LVVFEIGHVRAFLKIRGARVVRGAMRDAIMA